MPDSEWEMKGGNAGAAGRRDDSRAPFGIEHASFSSSPRAFTLLELIVVLLVLSVLFAMAAPAMSGFGAGRAAKQASSQVVSLARWAREQAISEGRTYRLNFVTAGADNPVYFVTAAYGATFERVPVEFGREFTIPEGVALTFETPQAAGMPYLEFLASGRCQPGHVRITSRDGAVTDLACLSATEPLRVVSPDELREVAQR